MASCASKELEELGSEGVETATGGLLGAASVRPSSGSQYDNSKVASAVMRLSTSNSGKFCQYAASEPALLCPESCNEVWA